MKKTVRIQWCPDVLQQALGEAHLELPVQIWAFRWANEDECKFYQEQE